METIPTGPNREGAWDGPPGAAPARSVIARKAPP